MTTTLTFAGLRLLVLLVLLLVAYAAGRRVLLRCSFGSIAEEVSFAGIVGLGMINTLLFLLGLARLLYASVIVLCAVLMLAIGYREIARLFSSLRSAVRPSSVAAVLLVLLLVAPLFWSGLYPPHIWDELSYHLASAKAYATAHGLVPTPNLRFCVFTQLNQMLFTAMLLVADDVAAQLTQFLALLLICLQLLGASRRISGSSVSGFLASGAWLGMPLALAIGTSAYIDAGLAMFTTAALIAFVNWRISSEGIWLNVAGACAGWAAASKYQGAYFVVAIFGCIIITELAGGGLSAGRWKRAAIFLVIAGALSAPWYVRNITYSGDPLFPFGEREGACGWEARDFKQVNQDLDAWGIGTGVSSLVRMPWELAFHPQKFILEAPFSPVLALAWPLALVPAVRHRRWVGWAAAILLGYYFIWFSSAQVPRYLFPVLPMLALLEAEGLRTLGAAILPNRPAKVLLLLAAAVALIPSYQYIQKFTKTVGPLPASDRGRNAYFSRYWGYPCYQYLNRTFGSTYRLVGFDPVYMSYFPDGTRYGDVLGPYRYGKLGPTKGRELEKAMRRLGAEFVLFSNQDVNFSPPIEPHFRSRFQLICASTGTTLWRLRNEAVAAHARELPLGNSSFENGTAPWQGSQSHPAPGVAESGAASVLVETGGWVIQTIDVPGDELLSLKFSASTGGPAEIEAFITWLDGEGSELGRVSNILKPTPAWRSYEFQGTSPPGAVRASVGVAARLGPVWIDNVVLRQIDYGRTASPSSSLPQTRRSPEPR